MVPDILRRLGDKDKKPFPDPLLAKKGSVWSLTFAEELLYRAEYFPPLTSG